MPCCASRPLDPVKRAYLDGGKTGNLHPAGRRHPEQIAANISSWKPSQWVFFSKRAETGRIAEPRVAHNRALAIAGIPHVSIHGLRRTFKSLAEWVEIPAGVVSQITGHKPSATEEKHYINRPLELLAVWHGKFEAWILEQAGIEFEQKQPGLKLVTAS